MSLSLNKYFLPHDWVVSPSTQLLVDQQRSVRPHARVGLLQQHLRRLVHGHLLLQYPPGQGEVQCLRKAALYQHFRILVQYDRVRNSKNKYKKAECAINYYTVFSGAKMAPLKTVIK